jgi:DNA end-binding protein Ku
MASTIWKGHLTFGLVSLPVRLSAAARAETIGFNQLHKHDNSRIKQVIYCQAEDKPVPRSELVKGYEYEKDRYVVVDDEEIKKFAPKTAKVMEILEFVKAEEVDPVYLETSYYLQPEEAGEKPYTLLFEALRRTGYLSIAKLTMHNREHIVVLRPGKHGLILHTLYYRDEVRSVDEFRTDTSQVKEKELDLATMLIETLAASFEPEKYSDSYRENIRALIDAKIQGQEIVAPPAAQVGAPVLDILEALKVSIAQLKKPAASAREAAAEPVAGTGVTSIEAGKRKRPRKVAGIG